MATNPSSLSSSISVSNTLTASSAASGPQAGWDGSVIIINAYDTSASQTQLGYEQTLEQLPLASGNPALAAGATDSVAVPQEPSADGTPPSSGDDSPASPLLYLIAAQSTNLFPVMAGPVMAAFVPPFAYPHQAVTASDLASMVQALSFIQSFQAYPTSSLSTQFVQATSDTSQDGDSGPDVSGINQFFQGTSQFQSVTFDSYIAMLTYVGVMPFACANFEQTYTYYIYSSSSTSGTSAIPLGTVVLTLNGPVTVSNAASCYTITWQPKSGPAMPLTYANGTLVSSTSVDNPAVTLQFLYSPLSTYTGKSSDYQTLVPTLNGSVDGTDVLGISQSPDLVDEALQEIQNFFAMKGVQIFTQIAGFVMAADMVYKALGGGVKVALELAAKLKGTPPTAQQKEAAEKEAEESAETDAGDGATDPQSLLDMQDDLSVPLNNFAKANATLDEIADDAEVVQVESSEGVDSELENSAKDLSQDEQQVLSEDLESSQTGSALEQIDTNVETQTETVEQIGNQEAKDFSTSQEEEIQSAETEETDLSKNEEASGSDEEPGAADDLEGLAE